MAPSVPRQDKDPAVGGGSSLLFNQSTPSAVLSSLPDAHCLFLAGTAYNEYFCQYCKQVQQCREQYRRSRAELAVPLIALVGYTNAGKSCLMNALTSAAVLSEDALFATLDTTVRKIALPCGLQARLQSSPETDRCGTVTPPVCAVLLVLLWLVEIAPRNLFACCLVRCWCKG